MEERGSGNGRLEERAVRGAPWTVFAFASSKLLAVATTIVLARILTPADFGIVLLAALAIGTLSIFSDLGLGGTLVVRQDLDVVAKGTILTLMLGMGAAIAVLVAAASPLVAQLFDEPRLGPILAVLSTTVAFGGLTLFYETVMQRELEFAGRFKALLAQGLAYTIVSLSTAAAGAGVWSLVAGQIAATIVYSAALLRLTPYRIRPAFDRTAARDAVRGGRGFLAQGGLAFLELNVDYAAVGRLLGAAQLGFYSMAFRLSELPYWAITEPVAKVTFPGFARMRRRGESVTAAFLGVLRLVTLVACPLGVLLSATAEPFTHALFGDTWLPMIAPLTVMGIWGTVNHFEATLGWLFNSVGGAGLNARISAVAVVPLLVGVLLAAKLGDLETVALVMLGHALASLLIHAVLADRRMLIPLADQWMAVRPVLGGAAAAWVTARVTVELTSNAPSSVSLAVSIVAGLAAYAGTVSVLERGILIRAAGQLRRVLVAGYRVSRGPLP